MTLESLSKLITPPISPVDSGTSKDWEEIEKLSGINLPDDYKQFITTFGTGQFGNFLLPFNPFSSNQHLNLLKQVEMRLDSMRKMIEIYGTDDYPYPLYPDADGLLPWGSTDNGDQLFWLTTGNPNNWSVVVHAPRDGVFEHYAESMTSFLEKLIRRDVVSQIFPKDFLENDILFLSIEKK